MVVIVIFKVDHSVFVRVFIVEPIVKYVIKIAYLNNFKKIYIRNRFSLDNNPCMSNPCGANGICGLDYSC